MFVITVKRQIFIRYKRAILLKIYAKPNQKVEVVRYNRELVITVIVLIEFDCSLIKVVLLQSLLELYVENPFRFWRIFCTIIGQSFFCSKSSWKMMTRRIYWFASKNSCQKNQILLSLSLSPYLSLSLTHTHILSPPNCQLFFPALLNASEGRSNLNNNLRCSELDPNISFWWSNFRTHLSNLCFKE